MEREERETEDREDREDRESLENLGLADVWEGEEDIEGAPNMEGVADIGENIADRIPREERAVFGSALNMGLAPNVGGAPIMGGVADNTGDRPYMCVLCRYTFSRSDILKRHFQKRHSQKCSIGGAPNMGEAPNMEGEQIIVGLEDLSIGDSANDGAENAGVDMSERDRIENGADEARTMMAAVKPIRAGAENAGMEREEINAGREMPPMSLIVRSPTSLFVGRERERWERAERDMERHRERHMEIAAAPIEVGAEHHEVENAENAIEGIERGLTEARALVVDIMSELVGDTRAEEMLAAAGPNMEDIENGRGDMAERIRLIGMTLQGFNRELAELAARESSGVPGIERSRQAFTAAIARLREKIVEQRRLRERATRDRESRESVGFYKNGHLERSERGAIEKERDFLREGTEMVRERERFLDEMQRLLAEERRVVKERDRRVIISGREGLLREMESSLRTREVLIAIPGLPHEELLSKLLRERMRLRERSYRRR